MELEESAKQCMLRLIRDEVARYENADAHTYLVRVARDDESDYLAERWMTKPVLDGEAGNDVLSKELDRASFMMASTEEFNLEIQAFKTNPY